MGWHQKNSLAHTTPFLFDAFANILAANVPNNIGGNLPFCYFASFLIISPIPFISNSDSSSNLTIFIKYSISSL